MFTLSSSRLNREQNKIITFQTKRRMGDYTKIAEQTSYTVGHVHNVLRGRRSPNTIITASAARLVANR